MKVRFKQPTGHNCGLYSIANVINDDFILKEEYLQEGEDGHCIFDLNNYLIKENQNFHISPIFVDTINGRLPVDFGLFPQKEESICPFLLSGAQRKEGIYHMVAIHSFYNRTIHIIDSLKEEVIETTFDRLHDYYPIIQGFYALKPNDKKDDGYIMVSYK